MVSSLSLLYGSDVALLSFWKKRKKEAKIGEKGQKEQKCEDRQNNKEDRRDTEEWKKEKNIIKLVINIKSIFASYMVLENYEVLQHYHQTHP